MKDRSVSMVCAAALFLSVLAPASVLAMASRAPSDPLPSEDQALSLLIETRSLRGLGWMCGAKVSMRVVSDGRGAVAVASLNLDEVFSLNDSVNKGSSRIVTPNVNLRPEDFRRSRLLTNSQSDRVEGIQLSSDSVRKILSWMSSICRDDFRGEGGFVSTVDGNRAVNLDLRPGKRTRIVLRGLDNQEAISLETELQLLR